MTKLTQWSNGIFSRESQPQRNVYGPTYGLLCGSSGTLTVTVTCLPGSKWITSALKGL